MPDKLPDIFKQQIHIFDKQLEPTDEEFAKLRDFIRQSCGISLSEDKRYLITQRLSPFLKQSSSKNYLELLQKLGFDPAGSALREKVVEAMTTNETSFFRDCHPFEALRDNLLPIVAARIRASRLKPGGEHKPRLWCAASSTGQEPYSIAMLIHETFGAGAFQDIQPGSVKMLATDISSEVLARAAKGRYSSAEISRGLPDALRGKYFTKSGSISS
jgi:chemotaxis protein methyltransferase CheR